MEQVLDFIQKLKAPPIVGWGTVLPGKKRELSTAATFFTAEQMWNVAEPDDRKEFVNGDMTARKFAKSISTIVQILCTVVSEHIAGHLKKYGGGDLMQLIEFHCKGNGGEGAVPTRLPRADSQESLFDPHSIGGSFGDTLRADQIHHNMFQCGSELDQQEFARFAFPEQPDIIATLNLEAKREQIEKLANDITNIRLFLSCLTSCDVHLTQAVFKVFLTNLLVGINDDDEPNERYSAQLVSGMKPLEVDAIVSAEYMKKMSKIRNRSYSGGPRKVALTIESDLVVWKGGLPAAGGEAESHQRMFLDGNVNIETKKFELLKGRKNRTFLTQVAAESLARRKTLATIKPKLYSILTDISGLYVLWREVNNGAVDVRWVSQQETSPERFVAIIYWLCLCSMDKSTVAFDPRWKQETDTAKQGERGGEGKEQGSTHGSELSAIDKAGPTNDDSQRSKQIGAEEEECENMVATSFDWFDGSDEDEANKWSTFYAIENYRILGTSLPLTRNLLDLHISRY